MDSALEHMGLFSMSSSSPTFPTMHFALALPTLSVVFGSLLGGSGAGDLPENQTNRYRRPDRDRRRIIFTRPFHAPKVPVRGPLVSFRGSVAYCLLGGVPDMFAVDFELGKLVGGPKETTVI